MRFFKNIYLCFTLMALPIGMWFTSCYLLRISRWILWLLPFYQLLPALSRVFSFRMLIFQLLSGWNSTFIYMLYRGWNKNLMTISISCENSIWFIWDALNMHLGTHTTDSDTLGHWFSIFGLRPFQGQKEPFTELPKAITDIYVMIDNSNQITVMK